jgi:hypothetical protein
VYSLYRLLLSFIILGSVQNTRNVAVQFCLLLVMQTVLELHLAARVKFQNQVTFADHDSILDENFHELCNLRHLNFTVLVL